MSVDILRDEKKGYQCMFCDTTMWAFGGLFRLDEDVLDFIEWLPNDPRMYKDNVLENLIEQWRKEKAV